MHPTAPMVRLACAVELDEALLRVRFEVGNEGDEVVHVYDDLGRSTDPKVLCDGGDGSVRMLVGVPALPRFPVYWMYHPKATALAPGSSVRRELAAALPLRERGVYYKLAYEAGEVVTVARLHLRVDVLRASRVRPDQPEPRGPLECVAAEVALPRAVALLRRADDFARE